MTKIALADMDGTLCDYEGSLSKQMSEVIGKPVGIKDPKYKKLAELIKKQPGFWSSLPPLELGFNIVHHLINTGWEVHILTKGPYKTVSAWSEKVEWCRKYFPNIPVTITENKGLVYGKILVDDWPDYCELWLEHRPRGYVIMPAYKYNEGFDEKYPGQIIRVGVHDLDYACDLIDGVAIHDEVLTKTTTGEQ